MKKEKLQPEQIIRDVFAIYVLVLDSDNPDFYRLNLSLIGENWAQAFGKTVAQAEQELATIIANFAESDPKEWSDAAYADIDSIIGAIRLARHEAMHIGFHAVSSRANKTGVISRDKNDYA
jgi:hypothetical protein